VQSISGVKTWPLDTWHDMNQPLGVHAYRVCIDEYGVVAGAKRTDSGGWEATRGLTAEAQRSARARLAALRLGCWWSDQPAPGVGGYKIGRLPSEGLDPEGVARWIVKDLLASPGLRDFALEVGQGATARPATAP
jgi:hypothetical protein